MSASNVIENTDFGTTEQPLSDPEAKVRFRTKRLTAVEAAKCPTAIDARAKRAGNACVAKFLEAEFKGQTPDEFIAHCASL
jgi:hypothetical protein